MLATLTPQPLWQIFADICQIPHPSHHEAQISQYVIDLAKRHNLAYQIDATGNILLRKAATPGMEDVPMIALQAHLDMVPQKNADTEHDFLTDPIQAYVDGDWVKARGTTLGADNGIGLASALAVLIDPNVKHGPLEVLLTVAEETGMVGAFGLQAGWLQSRYLINTDSEEEGEVFTGCAGGVNFKQSLPVMRVPNPDSHDTAVQLALKGLKGGHSGCDIHLGRGNATKLLARFLADYQSQFALRLADFKGGTLRNAIPREAFASLTLPASQLADLNQAVAEFETILRNEYATTEPNLQFTLTQLEPDTLNGVISQEAQHKIIHLLNCAPNGVVSMSQQVTGVVETSLNLGLVELEQDHFQAYYLIRSLLDSAKDAVVSQLLSMSDLLGCEYELNGTYPGWQPDPHSPLLKLVQTQYQQNFQQEAKVMVIHAGLECGLFKQPYPDVDMVSIGPTIVSPHSPDERVNIASVARYWQLLTSLLQAAAKLN